MIWQMINQWWINIKANVKSQLHILGTDHQLFGKHSKKIGEILNWKETTVVRIRNQGHQKSV